MGKIRLYLFLGICCAALYTACVPKVTNRDVNLSAVPQQYEDSQDSTNTADTLWKSFFTDPHLIALIDTALKNNQELNITKQEIIIAQNEVRARKGEYLPFLGVFGGAGVEKVGRYTRFGANDATTDIKPGTATPDPLPDFILSANVSWQVDIWKQLRNSKQAATHRYLSSIEGRNFMVTILIAEIANSYFELMALDNQLEILKSNIAIQQDALSIVKLQMVAGMVTELAVRKFEAEVSKNQSRQYYIQQQIVVAENRINFLVGRYPQPVLRNSKMYTTLVPKFIYTGIPSQLMANRPDIRQAEQSVLASKLDLKAARANFYPSLNISAAIGYNAFNPKFMLNTPTSMLYSLAGGAMAPLVNRNAIKAHYYTANARQLQAVYQYERTILGAYIEIINLQSNIANLEKSYEYKKHQVEALNRSISVCITLFKSARADYMEVLMTQRDALDARMELIETQQQQLNAMVNMYQALGGGWR